MHIRTIFTQISVICLLLFQSCLPAQEQRAKDQEKDNKDHRQYIINFSSPDNMTFCNEKVPLNDPEIKERLEREINALSYFHASTLLVIKRMHRWKPVLTNILSDYGIPEDFIYLTIAESNLENDAESYREAMGMWQLMEGTAKELGLEINTYIDERRDPFLATIAACKYLSKSYEKFNNWTLVAAAYNRGISGISQALTAQLVDSYYDLYLHEQTYRYVFKILAYKAILENPQTYGFHIQEDDVYQPWTYREIEVSNSIENIPQWAKQYNTTYRFIKYLNPWITSIDYSLPFQKDKVYTIRVPE